MNWRGRPLEGHQVLVELIGATTTQTGLPVRTELDVAATRFGPGCAMRSWRRGRLCGMGFAAVERHSALGGIASPLTARWSSTTLEAWR